MNMKHWAILSSIAAVALAVSGCGGEGTSSSRLPNPQVMFANMSPDSSPIDFFLDDDGVVSNLAFGTTASFRSVDAEPKDLSVRNTGDVEEIDITIISPARDRTYLALLFGLQDFGAEPEKRQRLSFLEVDTRFPPSGVARLIIFHGYNRAAGFSTPNIDFQFPGDTPQFRVANIPYGETRNGTVQAGSHTFEARRSGTENVYASTTQTVNSAAIYIVFVTGVEDGTGPLAPAIRFVEIPAR